MEARYALVTHNVVSMRAEPNDRSEQVSQAILNDTVQWKDEGGEFVRIGTRDDYEGWVLRQHLRVFDYGQIYDAPHPVSLEPHWPEGWQAGHLDACRVTAPFADVLTRGKSPHQIVTKLVYGTWVLTRGKVRYGEEEYATIWLPSTQGYVAAEALMAQESLLSFRGKAACDIAGTFLGTPYLWGGTTPFGFDCSGFVQRIYGTFGVILPRDAYLQAKSALGITLPQDRPWKAGDLVFFCADQDPRGRGITHVGMALGPERFIHASGKLGVAITRRDDPYYARTYRGAWRYRSSRRRT